MTNPVATKDRFDLEQEIMQVDIYGAMLEEIAQNIKEYKLDGEDTLKAIEGIAVLLSCHSDKMYDTLKQCFGLEQYQDKEINRDEKLDRDKELIRTWKKIKESDLGKNHNYDKSFDEFITEVDEGFFSPESPSAYSYGSYLMACLIHTNKKLYDYILGTAYDCNGYKKIDRVTKKTVQYLEDNWAKSKEGKKQ